MGAAVAGGLTVNLGSWAKPPADLKKIMLDAGRRYEAEVGERSVERYKAPLATIEKGGGKISRLAPEERQRWAVARAGLPNQMAKEADQRGLPGTPVFRSYFKRLKAAGYDTPAEFRID